MYDNMQSALQMCHLTAYVCVCDCVMSVYVNTCLVLICLLNSLFKYFNVHTCIYE